MKTKLTILLLIIIAIAIPIGILQAQNTVQRFEAEQAVANIEYVRVENGTVRNYVETLGVVEASAVASLSFTVGGTVQELYVQQGDYVAEGSVLAVLDNDAEFISYEQAVLALNRAEANQYDLQTVDEDEIILAEANLDAAWAGYMSVASNLTEEDRIAMEADYQTALDNAQQIAQDASSAPGGYDSPAYNLLTSEAGEAAFRAELTRLQNAQIVAQNQSSASAAWGRVLVAQAELEQTMAGASQQDLDRAELNMNLSQQQIDNLIQDYEDTFLIAPFEGYISDLSIEVGASVSQLAPVIEMTDIDPLVLTIDIDETDLADVREGLAVEVRFDALPDVVLEGTLGDIADIGTTVGGIVTYQADVLLDVYPEGVRVGMTADVRIITVAENDVITVPNGYLIEDVNTGRVIVNLVLGDGSLQEREVTLGLRGTQYSEVESGLRDGDIIALLIPPSAGPAPQGFGG